MQAHEGKNNAPCIQPMVLRGYVKIARDHEMMDVSFHCSDLSIVYESRVARKEKGSKVAKGRGPTLP